MNSGIKVTFFFKKNTTKVRGRKQK